MKYIVFFTLWNLVQEPCPCKDLLEKRFGKGYNCAVYHGKLVASKDTIYFDNKRSADSLYNLMVLRKDSAQKSTGEIFRFFYPYDSIGIKQITK